MRRLPRPADAGRGRASVERRRTRDGFRTDRRTADDRRDHARFVETELYPHEAEVERTGHLCRWTCPRDSGRRRWRQGSMPPTCRKRWAARVSIRCRWLLYEKELGRANYALHWTCVARPSNILLAGTPEQRERYLMPCIRGETWDCLAMTEPGAGSDLRGMKAIGPAGRRRLGAERHQAFHQPCRRRGLRHRLHGQRARKRRRAARRS